MDVMQSESFGPLIGIQKVNNPAEALTFMQDTIYGLTAGVYAQDESVARDILEQCNTGSVYWNVCDPRQPLFAVVGPSTFRHRFYSGIGWYPRLSQA